MQLSGQLAHGRRGENGQPWRLATIFNLAASLRGEVAYLWLVNPSADQYNVFAALQPSYFVLCG